MIAKYVVRPVRLETGNPGTLLGGKLGHGNCNHIADATTAPLNIIVK